MRSGRCSPTSSSPSCSRHGVVQPGRRRGWRWRWCREFVEGLTDRQAADAVRARLDWKYALGLELTDTGFDASVLTEFRARLLADGRAGRLLELMLARLREQGLLRAGGRQRTDATHVHMAVRDLHRLEQVIETLRAALQGPGGGGAGLAGRAGPTRVDQPRRGSAATTGGCPRPSRPAPSGPSRSARTAWCCWKRSTPPTRQRRWPRWRRCRCCGRPGVQQFYLDGGQVRWRDKQTGLPPGKLLLLNPYDVDARAGVKRGRNWRGYKAHFTETCEPHRPHLITHVATTDPRPPPTWTPWPTGTQTSPW
jgi:Transposase domain (DUF772)